MLTRFLSVGLAGLVAFALSGIALNAGEKDKKLDKNTHEGKLLSVDGNKFKMETGGKEHSHTLAAKAQIISAEGKDARLSDIRVGSRIRVTVEDGTGNVTRIQVLPAKEK